MDWTVPVETTVSAMDYSLMASTDDKDNSSNAAFTLVVQEF